MKHPTDEQLFRRLQQGDTAVMGTLFERYKTIIYNYFLRMTHSEEDAGDLLMTVFERIHKYQKSFKGKGKVRSWIFQIGNNVLKDYWRQQKRDMDQVYELNNSLEFSGDFSEEKQQDHKMLYKALNYLSLTEKNRVTMYYLLEMSYAEISEAEGISINAARISVHRGLKNLHKLLKNSGI